MKTVVQASSSNQFAKLIRRAIITSNISGIGLRISAEI